MLTMDLGEVKNVASICKWKVQSVARKFKTCPGASLLLMRGSRLQSVTGPEIVKVV